jgi:acetylglutamate kinase
LILLTDVEGIFANYEDKEPLISSLQVDEVAQLIDRGVIAGGMIPKVECCVKALLGE